MFNRTLCLVIFLAAFAVASFGAANIVIVNGDDPDEGFNDTTPAAPIGGNTGVTVGEQRLKAFEYAAQIWGSKLDSVVTIRIFAVFDPLPCSATGGVLGGASPTFVFANFPGAPLTDTWYPKALANKLAGVDLEPPAEDIFTQFNSDLGKPGCLEASGWYYGLDNNAGNLIDLPAVLLHEFSHGLGFTSITGSSGELLAGLPSIYNRYMYDSTLGKTWDVMTDSERQASAVNTNKLSWIGPYVNTSAPLVLAKGVARLEVNSPPELKGDYRVGTALFGPPLSFPSITGEMGLVLDGAGVSSDGCEPLTGAAAKAVKNKIALVDRGTCAFTIKVKNAQNAGAKAVVIADNVAGSPPPGLGGSDPTIVIPSVRISLADGNAIKAVLSSRWPASSGVNLSLGLDHRLTAGIDEGGRVLLWAPLPYQSGSSLSHWDTIATPNLLMEPFINPDLTHSVEPPQDLTLPLMKDIGW